MKVEELIIDGFKSYAARTVISNWDSQFNAITGLNGSGKSNILDAICFVLGIASMNVVRASNLQDLIYKRGQAGITKASVTIVFDNSEKSKSPIGFENMPKISVTRQIVMGGTSKYLINGHRAQQQSVLQLFQSVQLNINNPNFLIMQGKITKVLNMKPAEILSLIEEAAGTKMYEDRRIKAERTMSKKDLKLNEIKSLLEDEIEPKLLKLRNEKKLFLEHQQTQSDLENLERVVSAHDYSKFSTKVAKHGLILKEKNTAINTLNSEIELLSKEMDTLKEDLKKTRQQREAELKKDSKIKSLEEKESQLENEVERITTKQNFAVSNIAEERAKIKSTEEISQTFAERLKNKTQNFSSLESQYVDAKNKLAQAKAAHSAKEELLSTLSTGVSSKGTTDGGYDAQLQEARSKLSNCKVIIEQSRLNISHIQKEIKSDEPKLAKANEQHAVTLKEIEVQRSKISTLEKKLDEYGFDSKLSQELNSQSKMLQSQIYQLERECDDLKRKNSSLEFNYTKPHPNFDSKSVKGLAAQLFDIHESSSNSATALEVCAGGRLYNVVVDNEVTGSQLLERGQLRKRVTIIPLNKISSRKMEVRALKVAKELCPGKVELALNLIGYESEVAKAMEYIFGNRLICEDADTAKKVTFHPQVRTGSVTLEGDTYDPEGRLAGGSRRTGASVLVAIQRLNQLFGKVKKLKMELKEVSEKLAKQQTLDQSSRSVQQELSVARHQLQLLEKSIDSNASSMIIKKCQDNRNEITCLEERISEHEEMAAELGKEIKTVETDIKEFSSDKGSKLKKIKQQVDQLEKEISQCTKDVSKKSDAFQQSQIEIDQIKDEVDAANEQKQNAETSLAKANSQNIEYGQILEKLQGELKEVKSTLEYEKRHLMGLNEEVEELEVAIRDKEAKVSENKLSAQKLKHDLEKINATYSTLTKRLQEIEQKSEWVQDTNVLQDVLNQYPNVDLEQCYEQLNSLRVKFQNMDRKVNTNAMAMIENVEKKESSLRHMIKTIVRDKSKIEETINKLDDYKRTTLVETWHKVSQDFGVIFADLLPSSFAELVTSENKDVTEGLEVRVMLGNVWKESLVELSGGQRSLVALALIMALLQFKPAPMYILDEVDAALDLSHTQNIGHLIKTRFKGSQFIVVSLKEGMFANANRVFRTRFQDGTSVVTSS